MLTKVMITASSYLAKKIDQSGLQIKAVFCGGI